MLLLAKPLVNGCLSHMGKLRLPTNYPPKSSLGYMGPTFCRSICECQGAKGFAYGVFPCPVPPNGKPKTVLDGWAFVANAKGKDPETAAKFCVWACSICFANSAVVSLPIHLQRRATSATRQQPSLSGRAFPCTVALIGTSPGRRTRGLSSA